MVRLGEAEEAGGGADLPPCRSQLLLRVRLHDPTASRESIVTFDPRRYRIGDIVSRHDPVLSYLRTPSDQHSADSSPNPIATSGDIAASERQPSRCSRKVDG